MTATLLSFPALIIKKSGHFTKKPAGSFVRIKNKYARQSIRTPSIYRSLLLSIGEWHVNELCGQDDVCRRNNSGPRMSCGLMCII
jgi:hypothetical protein